MPLPVSVFGLGHCTQESKNFKTKSLYSEIIIIIIIIIIICILFVNKELANICLAYTVKSEEQEKRIRPNEVVIVFLRLCGVGRGNINVVVTTVIIVIIIVIITIVIK